MKNSIILLLFSNFVVFLQWIVRHRSIGDSIRAEIPAREVLHFYKVKKKLCISGVDIKIAD